MADFMDSMGQYLSNRVDQATQPFTDPMAYLNQQSQNRFGFDLSGNQANVKPVSTTINYGNNGEQTVTTKHEVTPSDQPNYLSQGYTPPPAPALGATPAPQPSFNFMPQGGQPPVQQAAMPPTPVAPTGMPPTGMPGPGMQTVAAPAPPAVPVAPTNQNLGGVQIGDINDGPPGTQVKLSDGSMGIVSANGTIQATPSQTVTPVNPAVPTNPIQTVPGGPPPTAGMQPTVEAPPTPLASHQQALIDAQKDPQKLNAYIGDENIPKPFRDVATDLLKQHYRREEEDAQREKQLKGLTSDNPREQSDAIKALRSKGEEGSLFKAYIFGRLGLNDLSREEQAKIAGPKFERIIVDGKSYMGSVNSKGGIVGAYDDTGKAVDDTTLAKINTSAAKFGTHAFGFTGGSITIPEGQPDAGQEYRQRTNAQTGQIENIITTGPNTGKLYTGTPGYEKRVTSQALIGQNQLIFDLQKKHGNNVLDALKDFEGRRQVLTPEERKDFFDLYGAQNPTIQKPFIPGVTPPANPQQKMGLPSETQTSGMMTTGYNPNETQGGMMQTRLSREELSTPVETIKQQQDVNKTIAEKAGTQPIESAGAGATVTAKSRAQRTESLPAREDDARRVLRTIDEVINHPGFEISTGKTQPIGSLMSMLPGTDARDWQAKYKELKGQNFLQAYANLRGTGSISDKEGGKAEQAISALSDPGISESDFKKNAELLKNDVRRRIDTERKSLGMKPLDWKQVETDMKKETMSPRDRDALDWAEKNPNDPRADIIRKRLGM